MFSYGRLLGGVAHRTGETAFLLANETRTESKINDEMRRDEGDHSKSALNHDIHWPCPFTTPIMEHSSGELGILLTRIEPGSYRQIN